MLADQAFEFGQSGDHQPRDTPVGLVAEFLGEVRGVDDKTRITPRGAVSDPVRIEQDDARIGRQFGQPAGGGERPVTPAPTTTQSAVCWPLRRLAGAGSGSIAYHPGAWRMSVRRGSWLVMGPFR